MSDEHGGAVIAEPDLLDTSEAGPKAIRGGTVRVAGYGAQVIAGVGSSALLFRHLGVADTGRYVTVLALIAIVSGATEIGLTNIGIRELAVRDEPSRRRLMQNLLGLRLVLSSIGVLGVAAFAWLAGYGRPMVIGTLLAGTGVVATSVQSTLSISLMAGLRLGLVTVLELVRQALLAIGIVVLVLLGAGLVPLLAIQGASALGAMALTAWLVRRDVPLTPAVNPREWRPILLEVLPFAAASIVAAIHFRAALIVLGLVSSAAETGYFGAAFRVTEVLLLVPNLLVGAAFPIFARAARDDHERLAYGVDRVLGAALGVGGAIMVGLVLGAPFVIEVIAGGGFAPAADVLRIQSIALMTGFASTTLFYVALSLRMHAAILATASLALVINVVLAAVLGASLDAVGAALATLTAELVGLALVSAILRRTHPDVTPGLGTLPAIAVAVAVGLAVGLIPGLPSVAAAALGTALYAAALVVLGAVPAELLEAYLPHRRGRT